MGDAKPVSAPKARFRSCAGVETGAPVGRKWGMNVHNAHTPLPPGTKVKYLRILQNFLKANHAMG